MTENNIWTVDDRKEEKMLRGRARSFSFGPKGEPMMDGKKITAQEFAALIQKMKKAMKAANGIGLSANQIGLDWNIFVAQVPGAQGESKFYAVLNPEIERTSSNTITLEEGCLSVPGVYGEVLRPERVTIKGFDRNGRPLKIKAWGLLARVFQHEIDHLNGKLFIDKAKRLERVEREESPRSPHL